MLVILNDLGVVARAMSRDPKRATIQPISV